MLYIQTLELVPNVTVGQVQLPALGDCRKPSNSRARRVSGESKKKKKQKTSGASLSAIIDPPTSSPPTRSPHGESVTKSVRPFAMFQS